MEESASGLKATAGSMGELSDRQGTPGFPTADAGAVSGQGGFGQPSERDGGTTQGTPPNNNK